MNKSSFFIFFIFLITGCVSNSEMVQDQIDEDSKEDLICKSEKVMGSNIPEVNCWTKEELERLEEKAKRMMQSEQRRRARMGG